MPTQPQASVAAGGTWRIATQFRDTVAGAVGTVQAGEMFGSPGLCFTSRGFTSRRAPRPILDERHPDLAGRLNLHLASAKLGDTVAAGSLAMVAHGAFPYPS